MDIMILEFQCVSNVMVFVKPVNYQHLNVIHVIKMIILEYFLIINVSVNLVILIMELLCVRVIDKIIIIRMFK